MLNNKGFTLIEVLATLVILGVILAIAVPMGTNAYESSKNKTEKIFVDKLARLVDDYITLQGGEYTYIPLYDKDDAGNDKALQIQKYDLGEVPDNPSNLGSKFAAVSMKEDNITFRAIINEGLISENEFINPKNKKKCNPNGSEIEIYKDEDSVYYFRFTLVGCDVNADSKYKYSDFKGIEPAHQYTYSNTPFLKFNYNK